MVIKLPEFLLGGVGGAIVAVWIATSAVAAPAPAVQAADPTAGQSVFQQNCLACHGQDAKGGLKLGDATAADIRWETIGPAYHNDPQLVARAITDGLDQDGQPLDDVMPRWKGKLSDAQVANVVAYLQTLTVPVAAEVKATPVHEDATPEATEEVVETSEASSVIAAARATSAASTSVATETAAAQSSASAVAPTTSPGTGGGGTSAVSGGWLAAIVVGAVALLGLGAWGVRRRS